MQRGHVNWRTGLHKNFIYHSIAYTHLLTVTLGMNSWKFFIELQNSLQDSIFRMAAVVQLLLWNPWKISTVKLGNKERFDKEQIGIKEQF